MVWNDSYFIAIAKNAKAHKVTSFYTLAISYCTFRVRKHTILGPGVSILSAAAKRLLGTR